MLPNLLLGIARLPLLLPSTGKGGIPQRMVGLPGRELAGAGPVTHSSIWPVSQAPGLIYLYRSVCMIYRAEVFNFSGEGVLLHYSSPCHGLWAQRSHSGGAAVPARPLKPWSGAPWPLLAP